MFKSSNVNTMSIQSSGYRIKLFFPFTDTEMVRMGTLLHLELQLKHVGIFVLPQKSQFFPEIHF